MLRHLIIAWRNFWRVFWKSVGFTAGVVLVLVITGRLS